MVHIYLVTEEYIFNIFNVESLRMFDCGVGNILMDFTACLLHRNEYEPIAINHCIVETKKNNS